MTREEIQAKEELQLRGGAEDKPQGLIALTDQQLHCSSTTVCVPGDASYSPFWMEEFAAGCYFFSQKWLAKPLAQPSHAWLCVPKGLRV